MIAHMVYLICNNMVHSFTHLLQLRQFLHQFLINIVFCFWLFIIVRVLLLLSCSLFCCLFLTLARFIFLNQIIDLCVLAVFVPEKGVLICYHPTNWPDWCHLSILSLLILDPVFVEIRTLAAHDSYTVVPSSEVVTSTEVSLLVDLVAAIAKAVHHIAEGNLTNKDKQWIIILIRVRVIQGHREFVSEVNALAKCTSIMPRSIWRLDA